MGSGINFFELREKYFVKFLCNGCYNRDNVVKLACKHKKGAFIMLKREEIRIRDPFIYTDVENGCYYMYGTTSVFDGEIAAGASFSVYKSYDLENFEGPKLIFDGSGDNFWADRDFWAAEMHKYNGKYYLFGSCKAENKCRGTHIFVCDTPDGTYVPVSKDPATPLDWECLDGTFYVENGKPYCVFCHEHTQILNGTICFMELKPDFSECVGEPIELFAASSFLNREASEECHNVTDGPFLYRKENGKLIMIWSTCADGYVQCVATSDNDSIFGKWSHLKPVFEDDGGHGMIFKDFDGNLKLTLHCPNVSRREKPVFFSIRETADSIEINN